MNANLPHAVPWRQLNALRLVCPGCGVTAGCNCGVAPIDRADLALLKDPTKSDRAIAAEVGVHHATVAKARRSQLDTSIQLGKRVGLDGRARRVPEAIARHPKLVGWTKEIARQFNGDLPAGFLRNTLAQQASVKAKISAEYGKPIPSYLIEGSVEAIGIANAIRELAARRSDLITARKLRKDIERQSPGNHQTAQSNDPSLILACLDRSLSQLFGDLKRAASLAEIANDDVRRRILMRWDRYVRALVEAIEGAATRRVYLGRACDHLPKQKEVS